jgi:hypothetical protein
MRRLIVTEPTSLALVQFRELRANSENQIAALQQICTVMPMMTTMLQSMNEVQGRLPNLVQELDERVEALETHDPDTEPTVNHADPDLVRPL